MIVYNKCSIYYGKGMCTDRLADLLLIEFSPVELSLLVFFRH
jgi:hypothetical protein